MFSCYSIINFKLTLHPNFQDPLHQQAPRPNEIGGTFDRGIITGRYTAGGVMKHKIDMILKSN